MPGPGTYDGKSEAIYEAVRAAKFGSGQRSQMAAGPRYVPGPGGHSPDYKALKREWTPPHELKWLQSREEVVLQFKYAVDRKLAPPPRRCGCVGSGGRRGGKRDLS